MKRKSVTFLIVLLLILLTAIPASAAGSTYMYLSGTEGDYTVTDASGNTVDLSKNPRLKSRYTVRTGENSHVWITLDSAKSCKLDENTAVTILRTDKSLTLTVSEGSIVFNVTKELPAGETMEIRTPAMITEIRGTSGEICARPESAGAAIFDGTVQAYAVCDGERYGEAVPVSAGYALWAQSADSRNAAAVSTASVLGDVKVIDVSDLTVSTLTEIATTAAYSERMDPKLMDDIYAHVQGYSDRHVHYYPASAVRTYSWTSDKLYCTAEVTCAVCDQQLIETRAATPGSGRAATCTTDGNRRYFARFNNAAFSDQAVFKVERALGHDWRESFSWSEDLSACTVNCVCARDNSHVETGPATVIVTTLHQPSCFGSGYAIYTATAVFDTDMHTEYKEVFPPALGHIWDEPTYEWNSDYSECLAFTECGRETCPLRQAETCFCSEGSLQAATCTEGGSGSVTASFKNEMFAPQTVSFEGIAPLGHDFGAPVFTWTGVETAVARSVCARNPEHISERDCEISCEVLTPATCAAEGLGRYTASVTFEQGFAQITYTDTKEAPIPATEVHTPGDPVFSATKEPYTPPTSDDFLEPDPIEPFDPMDPSTEEWSGTGTVRCKDCGKVLETETVAGSFDMKIYFHFTSPTFGEQVYDPETGSWSQR